jgi:hypothetical protein
MLDLRKTKDPKPDRYLTRANVEIEVSTSSWLADSESLEL